jgi:hypothetical protein
MFVVVPVSRMVVVIVVAVAALVTGTDPVRLSPVALDGITELSALNGEESVTASGMPTAFGPVYDSVIGTRVRMVVGVAAATATVQLYIGVVPVVTPVPVVTATCTFTGVAAVQVSGVSRVPVVVVSVSVIDVGAGMASVPAVVNVPVPLAVVAGNTVVPPAVDPAKVLWPVMVTVVVVIEVTCEVPFSARELRAGSTLAVAAGICTAWVTTVTVVAVPVVGAFRVLSVAGMVSGARPAPRPDRLQV